MDYTGQNTGVGSHSLLQGIFPTQGLNPGLPHCMQILYPLSHQESSLQPPDLYAARVLCPWTSPGKNTGLGSHSLLHGIFPTQGSNSGLPHCRQVLNPLRDQFSLVAQSCLTLGNPMDYTPPGSSVHGLLQARILEWVAISSSRGSSQPRDRIQVSHIACRFFTV